MRSNFLDVAKGIGILLVVYGHVQRGLLNASIIQGDIYYLIDSIVYTFHMPLFLFISGFLVLGSISRRSMSSFFINRCETVLYPYFLWMFLQGSIEVIMASYTNGDLSIEYLKSLWLPRAQFWYLYVLFFLSIAALFWVKNVYFLMVSIVISVASYIFTEYVSGSTVAYFSTSTVFFLLGIVFSKSYNFSSVPSRVFLFVVFLSFVLLQYIYHFVLDLKYYQYSILTLLVSILGVLFVLFLSCRIDGVIKNFLVYMGQVSILIYLGHILTGSGVRIILHQFLSVDNVYVHFFVGIIASFLPWLVIFNLRNRFSWIKFLYRIEFSRKSINYSLR